MSDLNVLINKRKLIRRKVTECHNRLSTFSSLSVSEKLSQRGVILSYQESLISLDSDIQKLKFTEFTSDTDLDNELSSCQDYMDKIQYCLPLLEDRNINSRSSNYDAARSLLKQPTAPLPKFSCSEGEDFLSFIKEFELTTNSFNYPDRDLLLLLKQQVEGRAKILLNSLEADKQSYNDAKALLTKAFASTEIRKQSVIKQLTTLNLGLKDDPFFYISKLRTIQESANMLNLTCEDFLTYFAWLGLNENFKKELILITNKTFPTFQNILDKFFVANERYEMAQKVKSPNVSVVPGSKLNSLSLKPKESISFQSSRSENTTTMATKVSSNSLQSNKTCSICSKVNTRDINHATFKCTKFPTAKSKLEQLSAHNGCVKCASFAHYTGKCNFRFKRKCYHCSAWHFSFLCDKEQVTIPKSINDPNSVPSETSSGVAVLPNFSSGTVLATFSFSIPVGGVFRGLKDNGSQTTFISQRLADKCDFKVLQQNVNLTVSGFNSSKPYQTTLVEVPLILGADKFNVPAMIVPDIKVRMDLPQLGVIVEAFQSKGYVLADSRLHKSTRELGDFDMLLGSDAAHCLLGKDIPFGKDNPSVFIETCYGIMLLGNLKSFVDNLPFLPTRDCTSNLLTSTNLTPSQSVPSVESYVNVNTYSFLLCHDVITPSLDDEIHDLNYEQLSVNCNFNVTSRGKLIESKLKEATDQILEAECQRYINYDRTVYEENNLVLNKQLIDFTLNNISREPDGRIQVPLLWNGKVSHLLSKNENLSRMILKSNFKKLQRNEEYLKLMDQSFQDQVALGIIERVENLDQFRAEHPDYSFLPHMGIFRPQRETTKCRVVFLSNLSEVDPTKKMSISHNQAIHAGPNLNQKLSSAFLHLRFDEKLLTYDLKKAFNMLSLKENDQAKLLFLWYRNVNKKDFTVVAYRNVRLTFGLRCSPFLLMISLYYILVLKVEHDDERLVDLKRLMFSLMYMDNGAITNSNSSDLRWAYSKLSSIYAPFKFEVQQLVTNDLTLQNEIDRDLGVDTPVNNKLFGLTWDRCSDQVFTKNFDLDDNANTKRLVLRTIASQFDLYGFNIPLLNRSRLFMHRLQCQRDLGWDQRLNQDLIREWKSICRQVNGAPPLKVDRCVGPRAGTYKLYAFTDASHVLYGVAIYLLHVQSGKVSFISAKNRMVNTQLKSKSIPSLELNAICLGVETLMELHRDLSGSSCMTPINISDMYLYTDSMCSLHWLNASACKLDKMQKRTVFTRNRIDNIQRLCEKFPVKFKFVSGKLNPADYVTRCFSYKKLVNSNFISGPNIVELEDSNEMDVVSVQIPNPLTFQNEESAVCHSAQTLASKDSSATIDPLEGPQHLIDPLRFSSFRKLVLVHRRVLTCANKWKLKAGIIKEGTPYNKFSESVKMVISTEQRRYFSDVFTYFESKKCKLKEIPNLITQLNVYLDHHGILRVKSKFKKWMGKTDNFPILLPCSSIITQLIVSDAHIRLSHSGCYSVLAEIRRSFYIPRHFSTIKKILKQCVHCRRFNNRTFKLNQSSYRDFRMNPPKVPFSNVFIDHLGPFSVKRDGATHKVWLLCVACTWTRAINLKICNDLSVKEFLRSFQLHCFDFGIPQLCVSDMGSQLTAGANIITNFLSDHQTQLYFEENNVIPLSFQQYFKGCSKLGSLVEVCVKMVKRLLFGSIKNYVLTCADFEYIVCHTVHLANRRPIAFKESLREGDSSEVPEPITPEQMIRGYELTSLNLIPELQKLPDDPDWRPDSVSSHKIKDEFHKLRNVRQSLIEMYHLEFLGTLMSQAVDKKDRYRPVIQHNIKVGDLVLLKEVYTKPNNYPIGLVKKLEFNNQNEVTGVTVLKGKTRELVQRHISTLIPFLESSTDSVSLDERLESLDAPPSPRVRRKAALVSEQRTRDLM